jgi:hypothetical protein
MASCEAIYGTLIACASAELSSTLNNVVRDKSLRTQERPKLIK